MCLLFVSAVCAAALVTNSWTCRLGGGPASWTSPILDTVPIVCCGMGRIPGSASFERCVKERSSLSATLQGYRGHSVGRGGVSLFSHTLLLICPLHPLPPSLPPSSLFKEKFEPFFFVPHTIPGSCPPISILAQLTGFRGGVSLVRGHGLTRLPLV